MNIGIDIDEVLCKTNDYFLEEFNNKHKTNFTRENLHNYHYNYMGDYDSSYVVKELINHLHLNAENYKIITGAKEILEKLRQEHKLFIITAREKTSFGQKTKNWLEKNFGEDFFEEIIFSTLDIYNTQCKSNICKNYNIDIMIEDAPHHALKCANKNIKVFLMSCPWNKNIQEHENITRVRNWNDIEEKLVGMEIIEKHSKLKININ